MSILSHRIWPEIKPYLRAQEYLREGGGSSNPRARIEVLPMPTGLLNRARRIKVPCVACGEMIHPIRARTPAKRGESIAQHFYYAATCPLDVNIGCSRGKEARDEYLRIRDELKK